MRLSVQLHQLLACMPGAIALLELLIGCVPTKVQHSIRVASCKYGMPTIHQELVMLTICESIVIAHVSWKTTTHDAACSYCGQQLSVT